MNTKTSNLAALYARSAADDMSAHCAAQLEQLAQEAAAQGMRVIKTYTDASCSGLSSKKCPQLRELLGDAETGLFKHLFVCDLSRLSRGPEIVELINKLQSFHVSVHCTGGDEFDLNQLSAMHIFSKVTTNESA